MTDLFLDSSKGRIVGPFRDSRDLGLLHHLCEAFFNELICCIEEVVDQFYTIIDELFCILQTIVVAFVAKVVVIIVVVMAFTVFGIIPLADAVARSLLDTRYVPIDPIVDNLQNLYRRAASLFFR